ncbi:hypothetical protein C5188_23255 [Serratia liquefaciens]|nr:hypothetical protein C5188_23255 [Serratia liquefaciens]
MFYFFSNIVILQLMFINLLLPIFIIPPEGFTAVRPQAEHRLITLNDQTDYLPPQDHALN